MNFFKRAVYYCRRQTMRSIILFFIFLILSALVMTALSIRQISGGQTENLKKKVGAVIEMGIDTSADNFSAPEKTDNGLAYTYQGDKYTKKVLEAILSVDGVIECGAENIDGFYASAVDFEYFHGSLNVSGNPYLNDAAYTTVLNSQSASEFVTGKYTLEEGRHIQKDDKGAVLISKELAEKNKLNTGDKINLYEATKQKEFTVEIVGIYSGTEGLGTDGLLMSMIPANSGFIDENIVSEIWPEEGYGFTDVNVYISEADKAEQIKETIQNLPEVKGKTFTYNIDKSDYEIVSEPLNAFGDMIKITVAATAGLGAAVITLLLVLWTRGRKKEAGILMAVGRGKAEIFMQLLTENFLLAVPAFGAAYGLSLLTGQRTAVFAAELASENVSALKAQLTVGTAAIVCLSATLIIAAAVFFAFFSLARLKPRAILS